MANTNENAAMRKFVDELASADLETLHNIHIPTPTDRKEMEKMLSAIFTRQGTFEEIVYSASIAATIVFLYVKYRANMSRLQETYAGLNILRRTNSLQNGFAIIDFNDLAEPDNGKIPGHSAWIDMYLEEVVAIAQEKLAAYKDKERTPTTEQTRHWYDIMVRYENWKKLNQSARKRA